MEQRLDATFLRPGLIHRAAAVVFGAIGIGAGIFLAAWGLSFLWHPPQDHRIDALVSQLETLNQKVTDGFDGLGQKITDRLKTLTMKLETLSQNVEDLDRHVGTLKARPPIIGGDGKTPDGDIIKSEVHVFFNVDHDPGRVVTGWRYNDGASANSKPLSQFCYYEVSNFDGTSTKTNLAFNGISINFSGVPRAEEAVGKCQWWTGS
jgi:hypothetical protein